MSRASPNCLTKWGTEHGLDEPLLAVKRNGSGTQLWLPVVSDGQGQLIAIADSGGQLNGALLGPQYDAGLWNSSGLTSNSHSFNPRRWATPGQVDTISTFRARQYDPATGKWLQEDPIGTAGGVNLYGYNGNDPNSFSDPFGLAADSNGSNSTASPRADSTAGDPCTTYENSALLRGLCEHLTGHGAATRENNRCAARCLANDYVARGLDTVKVTVVKAAEYLLAGHVACYAKCGGRAFNPRRLS